MDPVFLDRTGRRRRLFVAAGSAGGLLLLVAVVALIAGFTGAGPGSVPGWPAGADDLRVGRPEPTVSVRSRTVPPRPVATRTTRRTVTVAPATTPERPATTTVAPPSATPTAAPTVTTNPRRRVPTHTPKPHKSKDR